MFEYLFFIERVLLPIHYYITLLIAIMSNSNY